MLVEDLKQKLQNNKAEQQTKALGGDPSMHGGAAEKGQKEPRETQLEQPASKQAQYQVAEPDGEAGHEQREGLSGSGFESLLRQV